MASPEARVAGAQPRTRRISAPKVVLAVAVLGTFMAFVDATIVNIAIPNIAHEFSARHLSSVSWVLSAYNVVFAAFLVGGGQLADLLGRRRVFLLALTVFTIASTLCAIAPSLELLIAARVIQAAGAAMLVPSSLAIVLEAHAPERRMHAVALWSAVAALAAGIGPPLGGLLITASNWRLVFLVNVPVGLLAFVLAGRALVESRAPGRRRMPDLLGGAVLAVAIASLVLGVVKGQEWGWGNGRIVGAFAIAIVAGAYFIRRTSRHRAPVLDLSLLRIRAFALSNSVTVVMASGFYAYTLCNVLFLTLVWHYSILKAGLALTPGPFVAMAVAGPASRAVDRFGHRVVAVPGALIWAAGMAYFATTLGVHPHFLSEWLPGMVILGVGAGMSFPTLSGAAVGSVPGTRFAIATSLNSVARQVGAALGVAILTAILGNPSPAEALHAFEHGWWFGGACFLAGSIACLGLSIPRTEADTPLSAQPSPATSRLPASAGPPALAGTTQPTLGSTTQPSLAVTTLAALAGITLPGAAGARPPTLADSDGEYAQVTAQSTAEFLLKVPVFAGLTPELLDQLVDLASEVSLARGEWLFREGEPADGVYVVRLGHLEIVHDGADPEAINTLTRGAVVGELALLSESVRSASIRALRDSELLKIDKADFDSLLRSEPDLALGLTRVLSIQLQASRPNPPARRAAPVTIALRGAVPEVALLELADELSHALCAWGKVAVLHPTSATEKGEGLASRAEAAARFGPLVEHCELDHDQVIMVCGSSSTASAWDEFCISRADRVLSVVSGPAPEHLDASSTSEDPHNSLRGSDLVALAVRPGSCEMADWIDRLQPGNMFAISAGDARREDVARMARRLSGRAVGIVLSGGGARAFAHLGVLDVLLDAGMQIDRVGGVSMGAFIGGQLAAGRDSASIDACCYEEWVRRNPMNDYTLPRAGLIKGHKAEAMLERVFADVQIEELARPFYCASVDLRGGTLVIDRSGSLLLCVGASISLPLIVPPLRRDGKLLVDGSLLDNLPVAPMSAGGEGPVLAIDIKGGEPRVPQDGNASRAPQPAAVAQHERLPPLTQTMARVALLSSANTDEAARRDADFAIRVRVSGVGLLEFHQIDQARSAGRDAALAALEQAPGWLLDGTPAIQTGQRTVMRV